MIALNEISVNSGNEAKSAWNLFTAVATKNVGLTTAAVDLQASVDKDVT